MSETVSSMTGFARVAGGAGAWTWTWELKCVNGRGLDLRCRLPAGWEALEPELRRRCAARLARGNLQVGFSARAEAAQGQVRVNEALLEQIVGLMRDLEGRIEAAPPSLDGLLAMRGVLELDEEAETPELRAAREQAALADFEAALDALVDSRGGEGARLAEVVAAQLDEIGDLAERSAALEAARPEALRAP